MRLLHYTDGKTEPRGQKDGPKVTVPEPGTPPYAAKGIQAVGSSNRWENPRCA